MLPNVELTGAAWLYWAASRPEGAKLSHVSTSDTATIRRATRLALKRVPLDRPFRLLGVRIDGLSKAVLGAVLATDTSDSNHSPDCSDWQGYAAHPTRFLIQILAKNNK